MNHLIQLVKMATESERDYYKEILADITMCGSPATPLIVYVKACADHWQDKAREEEVTASNAAETARVLITWRDHTFRFEDSENSECRVLGFRWPKRAPWSVILAFHLTKAQEEEKACNK